MAAREKQILISPEGEWGWSNTESTCGKIAKAVTIGRGVFVGACAIILKGVIIGDRAVVGAGSAVTKDVPSRHIAAGKPARCFLAKQFGEKFGGMQ